MGIYYIDNKTFDIHKLPPEKNLYLRCLTNNLQSSSMTKQLVENYVEHQYKAIYMKYLHHLSIANLKPKGEPLMVNTVS